MVILRILRNLVDNALKYGGAGLSSISITHGEAERFQTVRVTNDGNAIAEEDRRNIFQKFKRSCRDSKVQGTGLGLAIVKDLVGLHGGQVWVESDGIQGVTFSFTIAKANLDRQSPKNPFANRQVP
jgi:signal transduction histidine kinase